MSTDITKLHLKDRLDEQVKFLEEYNARDIPEFPGWTFLLSNVVKEYGVCPYLNVNDEESKKRRIDWLHNQPDKGVFYHEIVKKLLDQQWMAELENELDVLRQRIREYVHETIQTLNNESKVAEENEDKSVDLSEQDLYMQINHDELIDNIKLRKEAKSQNKKVKESWNQTLRTLDYMVTKKGLDFSKYVHAVYGWIVRYKPPITTGDTLDAQFESLYERFNKTVSQLSNFKFQLEKEKEDAEQQLATLIQKNFQLEQTGRYYKKWSSLTPEKKEERIKSYCDWYTRKHNLPISLSDDMKKFIVDKLESKDLRIMDVKWDSKIGIITDVNINVSMNNDEHTFELGKRAPRILKSTRKTSKKKRDEMFQSEEEKILLQRINRLLLFELMKGQTLNKEIIVKTIVKNLHTRMLPESQIHDYVSSKDEEVLDVIKENPVTV
jgi:hypothetical protein